MFLNKYFICDFNPVICLFGFIYIYWYSIMYFLGFLVALFIALKEKKYLILSWNRTDVENLFLLSFIFILLGSRIGYIILYNFMFFYMHPMEIFKIWKGGMSFHGGLLGMFIIIVYISYVKNNYILQITDYVVPLVPIGLGLGRLGNFINGELWGTVNIHIPWAVLFLNARLSDMLYVKKHPELKNLFIQLGMLLPRHPSQIYEFFLEGVCLFLIIYFFTRKKRAIGSVTSVFLLMYGIFRLLIEYFREPDMQLGYFMKYFTIGQLLSIPMIIIGISILLSVKYFKINF